MTAVIFTPKCARVETPIYSCTKNEKQKLYREKKKIKMILARKYPFPLTLILFNA